MTPLAIHFGKLFNFRNCPQNKCALKLAVIEKCA